MPDLHSTLASLNAFLEDTCVVVATAYLLSRMGPIAALASTNEGAAIPKRTALGAGLLMGMLATTEVVFPGMRSPYVFDCLIGCLVMWLGNWSIAAVAIAVEAAVAYGTTSFAHATIELVGVSAAVISTGLLKRIRPRQSRSIYFGWAGLVSQLSVFATYAVLGRFASVSAVAGFSESSVLANTLGIGLIGYILHDARVRAASQRMQVELERSRVLLVSADLAALRARMRPHFLFNTLSAVAALCSLDPDKAERSVLSLGRLIRRTLDVEPMALSPLTSELDFVNQYLDIQKLRFADRLSIQMDVPEACYPAQLPAFGVQTLVENAFEHAFSGRPGPWRVAVRGRVRSGYCVVAVCDNGIGLPPGSANLGLNGGDQPKHGLGIIDRQLTLHFGKRSRIRAYSKSGEGTIFAFRVPIYSLMEAQRS